MKAIPVQDFRNTSTEELVALRTELRLRIKLAESRRELLTVSQQEDLREARSYMRSLMKEIGTRFIQQRLF